MDEKQRPSSSPPPPPDNPPSRTRVALTVCFHSACAIWSTILSKAALNGVEAPVTLLALQTLVQVLLLTTIGSLTGWIQLRRSVSTWWSLLPLTVARLVGILAKTYCLASVNASVYQIARGLLLPFTLILSLLVLRPRPYYPPVSLIGCTLVMAGFGTGMLADYSQMLTSGRGVVLGIGSSFTTAVESVVVKKFLGRGDEGMWQMVWMSNVMALAFYLPLLPLSGEMPVLFDLYTQSSGWAGLYSSSTVQEAAATVASVVASRSAPADAAPNYVDPEAADMLRRFLASALLTGVSSFLLTIATFMQIGVTSPTTHMMVTAARGVAQSSLAVVVLGEVLTIDRAGSMGLILAGSALYGWACDRYQHGQSTRSRGRYTQLVDMDQQTSSSSRSSVISLSGTENEKFDEEAAAGGGWKPGSPGS